MIIVLKNANFSNSNIGTLSTWRITRSIGMGATYEGVISVDKGAPFTATITIADGYELGTSGVTVTMNGVTLSDVVTINENVITITIASVTGNVLIKVPTVNINTGEEEPEIPDDITTTFRTIPLIGVLKAYTNGSNVWSPMSKRVSTYGNVKKGDVIEYMNPDNTFDNKILVYEVDPSGTPEFTDGLNINTEIYIGDLQVPYATKSYKFEKDCRFLAVMMDNNNPERDYTNYSQFCLYQLKREYTIGEPTSIHAYYGTYEKNTSKFNWTNNANIRALTVLDLKAGDIVESATDDLGFDVYKFVDGTITFDSVLVGGTTETAYKTSSWTSEANQRVMVIARSYSNPNGKVTEDLNNVFKVTFNS